MNKELDYIEIKLKHMQLGELTADLAHKIFYGKASVGAVESEVVKISKMLLDMAKKLSEYPNLDTKKCGFTNLEDGPYQRVYDYFKYDDPLKVYIDSVGGAAHQSAVEVIEVLKNEVGVKHSAYIKAHDQAMHNGGQAMKYKKALERIANTDYRGNKSREIQIAKEAIKSE